jgi:hypothetical protein
VAVDLICLDGYVSRPSLSNPSFSELFVKLAEFFVTCHVSGRHMRAGLRIFVFRIRSAKAFSSNAWSWRPSCAAGWGRGKLPELPAEPEERRTTAASSRAIREYQHVPLRKVMAGLGNLKVRAIERTRHVHLVENCQVGYLATFVYHQDPRILVKRITAEDRGKCLFHGAPEPRSYKLSPSALLDAVLQGLSRFSTVDIFESMERSANEIGRLIGWSLTLPVARQNITRSRITVDQLDSSTLAKIKGVTRSTKSFIFEQQIATCISSLAA